MVQPPELKLHLPVQVAQGMESDTATLWELIKSCHRGDLNRVKTLVSTFSGLRYAQYNYTPPIHFAVREGHLDLVIYFLKEDALDPAYRSNPFKEDLLTISEDRGHKEISDLLKKYLSETHESDLKGKNGEIDYLRNSNQKEFEQAVQEHQYETVKLILDVKPQYALDENYFWGEGILAVPAKEGDQRMLELLLSHGARVPLISKWGHSYYFNKIEIASFLLKEGMDPNHTSWQGVTLLHVMAQQGDLKKANLLLDYGCNINVMDDEYLSTPLGIAARWGHLEMVETLLERGADINFSGAPWSSPLAWAKSKKHQEIVKLLEAK